MTDRGEAAGAYHDATTHGGSHDRSRLVRFQPLDPARRPEPFSRFSGTSKPLSREVDAPGLSAVRALSGERLAAETAVDKRALSRLLFLAAGVTRVTHDATRTPIYFRAAMSAGNLHPIDLYVATSDGLDHYEPLAHALVRVRDVDVRGALAAAAARPEFASMPAVVVATGWPWRTGWKYGDRGYRHLFWDLGTMLAQLLAAADATGVRRHVATAFVDDAVARIVGADGVHQLPLALVALGTPDGAAAPLLDVAPVDDPLPPPHGALTFPLVHELHEAAKLPDADAVRAWRDAAASLGRLAPTTHEPASGEEPIDAVVLRRGSTRLFRREQLPRDALLWAMGVAARPVGWDASAPDHTLLEHLVAVHDVDGVPAGLARIDGHELVALRSGDARDVAQHLCLDQPLAGDAGYTVFHASDLDPLFESLGSRAYRVAQLEAGIASGRLALAAFSLGYGATGLTFYDDLVSLVFETTAAPMLVTAVGAPAYRNTAGGTPGDPAHLRRYGTLMNRLSESLRQAENR